MRKIKEIESDPKNFNRNLVMRYKEAREKGFQRINFSEIVWEREVQEIYDNLKAVGVHKVTISNQSTGLMSTVHEFVKRGCTIGHLVELTDGTRIGEVDGHLAEVPNIIPALTIIIK